MRGARFHINRSLAVLFALGIALGTLGAILFTLPPEPEAADGLTLSLAGSAPETDPTGERGAPEIAGEPTPGEAPPPRLGSEELTATPTIPPPVVVSDQFSDGNDIIYNVNLLRVDEGSDALGLDTRLSALASDYCPELGRAFLERYDNDAGNWAESLLHDAGGANLSARSEAAEFESWTSEILAWTDDPVDAPSLVSELWASASHHEILAGSEFVVAGAAGCRLAGDNFYVIVLGEAPPL